MRTEALLEPPLLTELILVTEFPAVEVLPPVVRFTLSDFTTVAVLYLTTIDAELKGFLGGFSVAAYGCLVPRRGI
jgi:hypothetical protein